MSKIKNVHLHPGKCPQCSSIFIFHQADSWNSSQQSRVDGHPLWKRPQLGFTTGYLAAAKDRDRQQCWAQVEVVVSALPDLPFLVPKFNDIIWHLFISKLSFDCKLKRWNFCHWSLQNQYVLSTWGWWCSSYFSELPRSARGSWRWASQHGGESSCWHFGPLENASCFALFC